MLCNTFTFLIIWYKFTAKYIDKLLNLIHTKMENYEEFSNKTLIEMYITQKDNRALDFLFDRHSCYLKGVIFNILQDSILTEDILQDTFVKAIISFDKGSYKEKEMFNSWIITIAKNLCFDYLRIKNKMYLVPYLKENEDGSLFDYFNEEKIIKEESYLELNELINRLPEEQKDPIILRFFFDFSFKEIAKFENIPINTALGRVRYGLKNLRKMLYEKSSCN